MKLTYLLPALFLTATLYFFSISSMEVDNVDRTQENEFHQRVRQKFPSCFEGDALAFYKRIDPITSEQPEMPDQWRITSVSIGDTQLAPEGEGSYRFNDAIINIAVPSTFSETKNLDLLVNYQNQSISCVLSNTSIHKNTLFHKVSSYNDLIQAVNLNRINEIEKIVLNYIFTMNSNVQPLELSIEIRNTTPKSVQLRGYEIIFNKDIKKTFIFFDFSTLDGLPHEIHNPVQALHATTNTDKKIIHFVNQEAVVCEPQYIYGFFNTVEMRSKWITDENGFFDLNKNRVTILPSCYSIVEHGELPDNAEIVWSVRAGNTSFYEAPTRFNITPTNFFYCNNNIIHLCVATTVLCKEFLSINTFEELNLICKLNVPSLKVRPFEKIENGFQNLPKGLYQKTNKHNFAIFEKMNAPKIEPVVLSNQIEFQDGLQTIWPNRRLKESESRIWSIAAQHFFTREFEAKTHVVNQLDINLLRSLTKLTSIELDKIKLCANVNWDKIFTALQTLRQLKKFSFTNNNSINLSDSSELLREQAHALYQSLANLISHLHQLRELNLQGLWLKPYTELGSGFTPDCWGFTSVSTEVAKLTYIINHSREVIKNLIRNATALQHLRSLSLDSIPIRGSSKWARRTRWEFYKVDAWGEGRTQSEQLDDLNRYSANQIASMPRLTDLRIYTTGGNCSDYFSREFIDRVSSSRNSVYPNLPKLTIAKEVLK